MNSEMQNDKDSSTQEESRLNFNFQSPHQATLVPPSSAIRFHRILMVGEKCKRVRETNIDSLPDELLREILARLSDDPDYLHNKARLVCRRWRHLIHSHDFIKTQLHRSTYGLFICSYDPIFVTATQGRIETPEISNKVLNYFNLESSCNGLALLHHYRKPLIIMNLVTRQQLVLPSFSFEKLSGVRCCIGYAAASMEYKVTLTYQKSVDKNKPRQVFIGILSVGRDKSWRHVGVENLSVRAMSILQEAPLVACTSEGFITFSNYKDCSYLTLDVETEILTEHPSPLPEACLVGTYSIYLSTGRSLSLLVVHKYTRYLMELWEMKAESGEWRKVAGDIKLGARESWLQPFSHRGNGSDAFLMPVGWVRFPEVLAFYFFGSRACIFFNLNTQEISSMELQVFGHYPSHAHKKSLAWFS